MHLSPGNQTKVSQSASRLTSYSDLAERGNNTAPIARKSNKTVPISQQADKLLGPGHGEVKTVHLSPGNPGAGLQRIIYGKGGEIYFSPDHYKTFLKIK